MPFPMIVLKLPAMFCNENECVAKNLKWTHSNKENANNLIKCYKCGKIGKGVEVNIRPSSNGEFVNFINYKKD